MPYSPGKTVSTYQARRQCRTESNRSMTSTIIMEKLSSTDTLLDRVSNWIPEPTGGKGKRNLGATARFSEDIRAWGRGGVEQGRERQGCLQD